MAGGEGMDDPGVELGLAEGTLNRLVIDAGHFDGDDHVGQSGGLASGFDLPDHLA